MITHTTNDTSNVYTQNNTILTKKGKDYTTHKRTTLSQTKIIYEKHILTSNDI